MSTILFLLCLLAVFVGFAFLMNRFVWQPRLRREAEAAPRITLEEARSFWDRIDADTLPIAKAIVQDRKPLSAQESRLGGAPLALDGDATWPRSDKRNVAMAFLAQLNFAELPELEDFPRKGILQIFTTFDMVDETCATSHCLFRWDPDPKGDRLLEIPEEIGGSTVIANALSDRTRQVGLPLLFEVDSAIGNPCNWPHAENDLPYENRLPENDEVAEIIKDWEDRMGRIVSSYGTHWVGGHPHFVQYDIRTEHPDYRHLDRTLLHIGWDDNICVGDAGMLNVLISHEDLRKQDFDKAILTWDCH